MNTEDDEVSLIDLLLVIAENLRLLIIGPIVVGALAWVFAYLLPQHYASEAILTIPKTTTAAPNLAPVQAAAVMVSPLVLDPIVESFNLFDGNSMQQARVVLANQVKVVVGKDELLHVTVTAKSPERAQAIANSLIDTWLKTTVPTEQLRVDLQKRLSYAQSGLASISHLLSELGSGGLANLNKPLTRGDAGLSFVGLGELQSRYLNDVLSISRDMQGLGRDVIKQPPTLPTESVAPKKALISGLATIATGFVLLLWVFVRSAWRNAAQDPEMAQKQSRLAAALGWRS